VPFQLFWIVRNMESQREKREKRERDKGMDSRGRALSPSVQPQKAKGPPVDPAFGVSLFPLFQRNRKAPFVLFFPE
jgi:hypothetical protein